MSQLNTTWLDSAVGATYGSVHDQKLMPFCNEVQQFVVSEVSDIISALSLLRAPSTNVSVPGGGLVTHLQSVRRRQLLNLIRGRQSDPRCAGVREIL
ncbi:MAG: hypothetical protein L0K07_11520 [Yaniella sp.]|uniref:hypothetical protein n=2 Tax=Yaniella sp. TaxID=2773929 RepID=UPI0026497612|nr:hypothetical protein [Yaniella sp.]MDN5730669.1 hypothetical protein [Yaniella sp.]MDN5742234.1 hypothetical protein [Yaniella sp.]MDN5815852.1 hypothetical protein [Yaniella sp.]MDN5817650.1 hypothetical protein [Yaniella sp.]MDN5837185.1 hypothetical protein [Yaniella sp.]